MELASPKGIQYKVTKRMPELLVAETKIFNSKDDAKKQFDEWLQ